MAVTITRSVWIDDDGTGTTGTVINNAVKTSLYNEIDTALAKVAQLAGGNTFNANQIISSGRLFVNTVSNPGNGMLAVSHSYSSGQYGIVVQNTDPLNTTFMLTFLNSVATTIGSIQQNGSTIAYNTTSDARLKEDLGPAVDLAALRALVVHDFAWKADGMRDRGVFAQDAHALYPRAISPGVDATTDDGSLAHPWMTDYSKFVPDLIVGWQQHHAELAALRDLLATVKG